MWEERQSRLSATHSEVVTLRHCVSSKPIRPIGRRSIHAHGRSPGLRIDPSARLPELLQWHLGIRLRRQLRGQLRTWDNPHRIPCYPLAGTMNDHTIAEGSDEVKII
jgi:hypothetical protein